LKAFSFFPYFNRSQRRGIILLFVLIFLLQVIIFLQDNMFPVKQEDKYKVPLALQQQYDSLKIIALEKRKKKIYPFNPNYLTDFKAYYLGFSVEEIDRILTFRKQGKFFQNKKEFQQISGISDSLFQVLEPFINIPVYKKYSINNYPVTISTTDINKATATDLQVINGIGAVLSKRIVKYRNMIGGFTRKNQLNKVYGLEPEVIQRVWKKFSIIDMSQKEEPVPLKKLSINSATPEELQKIYGIGEKLSQRIVKYRDKLGGFTVKEQLNEVYGLSPEVIARLWKSYKIVNPNRNIQKIDLNDANIIELSKNPYISYQLAKKIVSYRTIHGAFTNFDQLLKVEDYPGNKHKLITLYLTLKN